jgi:hypothetical protein
MVSKDIYNNKNSFMRNKKINKLIPLQVTPMDLPLPAEMPEDMLEEYWLEEKSLEEVTRYCKDFDLHVILPIGKFSRYKDIIVVFHLAFNCVYKNGVERIWFIKNAVLYKNKLYNHNKFFGEKERIGTNNLLEFIDPKIMLKFPYTLFTIPSKEFLQVKKEYFTPIRSFLCKIGVVEEGRGKSNQELIKERNRIIISKYKESRSEKIIKQYVIIMKIRKALDEYAERIKSSDRPKEAVIINRVFGIKDSQIWRIIQKFHKK